jgi:threonine synthase
LSLAQLYFKNEAINPTGSFKDRFACVTINCARAFGYRKIVVSSTGNQGMAVIAYANAAGMTCLLVAPRGTSDLILDEARRYGAHVFITSPERRLAAVEEVARSSGWFPVGPFLRRCFQNPFGVEGYKTLAYELLEHLGAPPAAMLFPCARGNGLYGAWKGFQDAIAFGWTQRTPTMIACQPNGANSIEVSLARGSERAVELPRVRSVAPSATETVASDHSLKAIRHSGGTAVSASDNEILAAMWELLREGISVEPASALPVACLQRLVRRRVLDPAAPVVCILTATGLRWPVPLPADAPRVRDLKDAESVCDHLADIEGVGV